MKQWLKEVGIRTIKTMAETACSLITVGGLMSDVNWLMVLSATLLSGIYTILFNISKIKTKEQ